MFELSSTSRSRRVVVLKLLVWEGYRVESRIRLHLPGEFAKHDQADGFELPLQLFDIVATDQIEPVSSQLQHIQSKLSRLFDKIDVQNPCAMIRCNQHEQRQRYFVPIGLRLQKH